MKFLEIATFIIYFLSIIAISLITYKKQKPDTSYVLGNRSLNFWLTALSAHASDMSNWLFMGFPMIVFTSGVFQIWAGIGLVAFMLREAAIFKILSSTDSIYIFRSRQHTRKQGESIQNGI